MAQGKTVVQACKQMGITEQTYYRWRKEYGGLKMDQAKRLKALEKENGRLKKLVADWSLDNQILKEVSAGNLQARRKGGERWYRSEINGDLGASPNVGPAECWGRPDPRSAGREDRLILTPASDLFQITLLSHKICPFRVYRQSAVHLRRL